MMDKILVGSVAEFNSALGMGEVENEIGRWPFHLTEIADTSRTIDVGQLVAFTIRPGGPGQWEASHLVKI